MVGKICKVQMNVNPCLQKKGLRHASQNTSLPLQIKVSFVINGATQTNPNKIQQTQFTQNPKPKQNMQTNCCKQNKTIQEKQNNLANKLKGKKISPF
jgi:hypothetical protein